MKLLIITGPLLMGLILELLDILLKLFGTIVLSLVLVGKFMFVLMDGQEL